MEDRLQAMTDVSPSLGLPAVTDEATQMESSMSCGAIPPPEPRVPIPKCFSGDRRKFWNFRNSCELYFSLLPQTFSSQDTKVEFIILLLQNEPQSWAHHLREQHDPALATMDSPVIGLQNL